MWMKVKLPVAMGVWRYSTMHSSGSINIKLHRARFFLTKVTSPQPVKKFREINTAPKFIIVFTTARHLPYPEPDQSTPRHPILFL